MQTIRPYPCSEPDCTTVPHCAAWIGVPVGAAMSSPLWRCPGRCSPNGLVTVPLTGAWIVPLVHPPAVVVGGGAGLAEGVCFGAGFAAGAGAGADGAAAPLEPVEPEPLVSTEPEPLESTEPEPLESTEPEPL